MKLTDAEWKVMEAAWDRAPVPARAVLDAVRGETGWAYATVKTILARLAEKGAVKVRRQRNVNLYAPLISRDEARQSAVHDLMDRAFGGKLGHLMLYLLTKETLSEQDRTELLRMQEEQERAETT